MALDIERKESMNKWIYRQLTELTSRKWLSRLTGSFAQSSASKALIPHFAKLYGINIDEAEKQIHEYKSLNEFFTRRLKKEARPVEIDPTSVISPVDALITGCGKISNNMLLNVKGQSYSVTDLLQSEQYAKRFENGYFYVLYLSPTDYHRIHTPIAGSILERKHLKGKVYPVNDASMTNMSQVLNRNERLITYIEHESHALVSVVKVGALNVSSIQYVDEQQKFCHKGDELAYFEFGSTVVLLFEANTYSPADDITLNSRVKMGERLGLLH